jgi:hypothetical protein
MTVTLATRADLNRFCIPAVANVAERDALGIPQVGARVHRLDTGAIERWTGTVWVVVPVAELVADIAALETGLATAQADVAALQVGRSRLLKADWTQVAAPNDTNENVLGTYTIPANTLVTNHQTVRAWFTCRVDGGATGLTWRLYFGSVVVLTVSETVSTAAYALYLFELLVGRRGTDSQFCSATRFRHASNASEFAPQSLRGYATPTEDDGAGIVLKLTAQRSAAGAEEYLLDGFVIELLTP